MGRQDWYYINLPKLMIKRLDQFLDTPRAKSMGMNNKTELMRYIINDFLSEQERTYNNMQSIHEFIMNMKDHDHLVLTASEGPHFHEILKAFMARSAALNQISVLFISKQDEFAFIGVLDKVVDDANSLFRSQDIIIIHAEECYADGVFSLELAQKHLNHAAELAKRKGRSGLNILGTVPGKLVEQKKYNDALSMERGFHDFVQNFDTPISVICMYNTLPDDVQNLFMECHDIIVKRAITESESGLL